MNSWITEKEWKMNSILDDRSFHKIGKYVTNLGTHIKSDQYLPLRMIYEEEYPLISWFCIRVANLKKFKKRSISFFFFLNPKSSVYYLLDTPLCELDLGQNISILLQPFTWLTDFNGMSTRLGLSYA